MANHGESVAILCWGCTTMGQLGLGGVEQEQITSPTVVTALKDRMVQQIACGMEHTLFVMNNGTVLSCGNNDCGQLGHEKSQRKPEQIRCLETHSVRSASCGVEHSMAVTEAGALFSWGGNQYGQLGRATDNTHTNVPRLVKSLSSHTIAQVSCGYYHTVALTKDNRIYTWGRHHHGQLGIGVGEGELPVTHTEQPMLVSTLTGLPVAHIAAGGYHTFILSHSGALYGWGKNSFGQLGVGDNKDQMYPVQCKTLRSQQVKYISCGEDHTAVLTKDGGVFTFGAGMYGQLGHNSKGAEFLPRKVFELMGSVVTQVQCGRKHTMAYVLSSGRVYTFGQGGNGQLGTDSLDNLTTPHMVNGPFVPVGGEHSSGTPKIFKRQTPYVVKQIFAGGDQCFVIATHPKLNEAPVDHRELISLDETYLISDHNLHDYISIPAGFKPPPHLAGQIDSIFGSSWTWNASFLTDVGGHYHCSSKNPGVCLHRARHLLTALAQLPNNVLVSMIVSAIEKILLPSLTTSPPDVECLRVYYILPTHPVFADATQFRTIQCPFAKAVVMLDKAPSTILGLWWTKLDKDDYFGLVNIYKKTIIHIVESRLSQGGVNEKHSVIELESFYIPELKVIDIRSDYVAWLKLHTQRESEVLFFCDFPFVLDGQAKTILLQTDAVIQMQAAVDEANRRNFNNLLFNTVDPISPCLVLFVRRDHLVGDTLNQLNKQAHMDFKKPLKVMFIDEEALDAGGVRKEFFMLLIRELQDPKYGMFEYFESSHSVWFSHESFEDTAMYTLIGLLCGLAIYNSTIIDLHFPDALYKKLLKKPISISDLTELDPTLAKGFEDMLQYEGADFAETFDISFEVVRDRFGEVKKIPLIPDGASVKVTVENRELYVESYLDYMFNQSVKEQFQAFYDGFHRVVGGRVLELFQPTELRAMVVGNEYYDWEELEKTAEYKGIYNADHRVIRDFWAVLHEMTLEQKKKFLFFLTGSDRVPIHGMKAIKVCIQSNEQGDAFLPVAHTCFNILDLPNYSNKDVLRNKLLLAVENGLGFGIV